MNARRHITIRWRGNLRTIPVELVKRRGLRTDMSVPPRRLDGKPKPKPDAAPIAPDG